MEQRLELVMLARSGEFAIKEVAKRFGVSAKTAHKWIARYEAGGVAALEDRSRAPKTNPGKTPDDIERLAVKLKRAHPTWGPKKIQVLLERDHGIENPPAPSTLGEIFKRHGLVTKRRRKPGVYPAANDGLTGAERPNHVWGVDHKGWFLLGDGTRCVPLTVTDLHSRYIVLMEACADSTRASAKKGFEKAFRSCGLPGIIRVDNGSPFASMGPGRLSKLSVWWIAQGIQVEFTRPGNPQDNGSHERMHRTMKAECCTPGSAHQAAQQQRFGRWRKRFNEVRPHESLGQRTPAEVYRPSNLRLDGTISARLYEPGEETLVANAAGFVSLDGVALHVGDALAGAELALDRRGSGVVAVRYANVPLGEYRKGQADKRLMIPGYFEKQGR